MHDEKREIKFGERANKFDKGFEGKFLNKFYEMMVDTIKVSPNAKYLDVACGTGELLSRMDKRKKIEGYGIDIDGAMIAVAKEKCPQMDIRVGKCDELPYEDGTFDAVSVCMAYHHFENREGFEKEAKRVLKKSGKIYIAELRLPMVVRTLWNALLRHKNIVAHIYSLEEIVENFKTYGFELDEYKQSGRVQIVCMRRVAA
jgi:ubiquinone/menaquinone biosynthesis C-methylase UbiE